MLAGVIAGSGNFHETLKHCHSERSRSACDDEVEESMHLGFPEKAESRHRAGISAGVNWNNRQ
jgi:hypothetical protein